MTLEMRTSCQRCTVPLPVEGEAFICSFECTYCSPCAEAVQQVCPNCGGELVSRPRRLSEVE